MRWRALDTPDHPADFKHTTRKLVDQSTMFKTFYVDKAWPIHCTEVSPPKERKVTISDLMDMGFTDEVGEVYTIQTSNTEIYSGEKMHSEDLKKIRRRKKKSPWRL